MSSYKYDFDAIKDAHMPFDVAQRLKLPLKKEAAAYRCPCPSGKGDERSLVITPGKGRKGMYSHALKSAVSVIDLVSMVQGVDARAACAWLTGEADVPEKSARSEPATKGFKELDYLEPEHEAVIALGLEPEDAERIGCGFAPRGVLKGTVAWPVRLSDGTLIGYIGLCDATMPPRWNY